MTSPPPQALNNTINPKPVNESEVIDDLVKQVRAPT
jgi:hypothetical protein